MRHSMLTQQLSEGEVEMQFPSRALLQVSLAFLRHFKSSHRALNLREISFNILIGTMNHVIFELQLRPNLTFFCEM